MMNGFIIPTYCESHTHLQQLKRCISSIRRFFYSEKIILIDDYSEIDITILKNDFKNLEILKSPYKGAGDMVTYKILLDSDLDKACIIQDSMKLENRIDFDTIEDISFLWYFTNHRIHWHTILEEQSEYNLLNKIVTHDDLNLHYISKIEKDDFRDYCNQKYNKKNEWSGCFGCLSIVTKDFTKKLNERTGIVDFLTQMNTNRLRRSAESIFSLACFFIKEDLLEKAYDGIYYDGFNTPIGYITENANFFEIEGDFNVTQVCKKEYFSKLSFNRKE